MGVLHPQTEDREAKEVNLRVATTLLAASVLLVLLVSREAPSVEEPLPAGAVRAGDPTWGLVWSDEFDKPHYLILNAAVGGDWGGQKGIDDGVFPQKYLIDDVRVYERLATRSP